MTVSISDSAPAKASSSGFINAAPEVVWSVLVDLDRWPQWNDNVAQVIVEGPIAPATQFRWKSGGVAITSRLIEVTPVTRITWTGRVMGISAIHIWELESHLDGTRIKTEESFDGIIPQILPGLMRRMIQKTLDVFVQSLKTECERR